MISACANLAVYSGHISTHSQCNAGVLSSTGSSVLGTLSCREQEGMYLTQSTTKDRPVMED